ncbi:MAG: nicotinamide-nucleotide amidase [Bradymonadia bacterium]|jgi:nicotinamide-nucleotide amidase
MLCIGDELLDGRTADRNAHYLGGLLAERGIALAEVRIVDDVPSVIEQALGELSAVYPAVITSGGLGPTLDDRTRHAIAAAAGVPVRQDIETLARLKSKYRARNREWNETNARQAVLPETAIVLESDCGTADAFLTDVQDSKVLSLPGVPSEFRSLLEEYLHHIVIDAEALTRHTLHLFGIGESDIAERLEALAPPSGVDITYKAEPPYVRVGIRGPDPSAVERFSLECTSAVTPWLVPRRADSMAEALGIVARAERATIATVESCTGGLIGSSITDVAGSSSYYWGGWVTYANEAKTASVGVQPETLELYGAVSAEVALEMAQGALRKSGADVAVSVTGIAGPDGGSDDKPVGRVFIGVAGHSMSVVVRATFAGRSRASFKRQVVATAQLGLIHVLTSGELGLDSVAGVDWSNRIE